jgi:HD superfamily phosphodiesterase
MDLTREITSAETRFLTKLEEFFLFVFPENKLESHGLDHHRRVWLYSKELLRYQGTENLPHDELLPAKLIIAAYLHDVGMITDAGPRHGIHSRDLCEKFLRENNLRASDFTGLLDAVRNHDDKEYRTSHKNQVLHILSVADDLDALGYIGIFRYLEIYLMRGVKFEELGVLINNNVISRFNNLKKSYGDITEFMERHNPRYEIIMNFFNSYIKQTGVYTFGTGTPSGYCGVVELIYKMVSEKISLRELISESNIDSMDQVIKLYFSEFRKK